MVCEVCKCVWCVRCVSVGGCNIKRINITRLTMLKLYNSQCWSNISLLLSGQRWRIPLTANGRLY